VNSQLKIYQSNATVANLRSDDDSFLSDALQSNITANFEFMLGGQTRAKELLCFPLLLVDKSGVRLTGLMV
jgi:hypothetical protein